jgi:hypothetical protein
MRAFARSKIITLALAMLAASAFVASTRAAEPDAASKDVTTMPQPLKRASADDCVIIVEIGKSAMGWGATAPDYAFYPEFAREGGGTYLEECPWKQLGVAEPLTKAQQPKKGFFITRPRYEGAKATAELEVYISGPVIDGKQMPPFLSLEICSLEKQRDRWQLLECKLKVIT